MTAPLRSLLALGLLLAGGCKLFDRSGAVRLAPAGAVTVVDGRLEVLVTTDAGGEVRLLLDGAELPDRVRAGKPYLLELPLNGTYALSARAYDGGIRLESEATEVVVAWPPPVVLGVEPLPVLYRTGAERLFQARLTFSEQLTSVQGLTATGPGGRLDLTSGIVGAELRADIAGVHALDAGPVELAGRVCDVHGSCLDFSQGWTAPTLLQPTVSGPAPLRRIVNVMAPPVYPEAPGPLELLVDGVKRADLPIRGGVGLDTTTLADGPHALTVDLPGFLPSPPIELVVDNTPPTATCSVETRPDDADWSMGALATFSEPVSGTGWNGITSLRLSVDRPAALPATLTFVPPAFVDLAGNELVVVPGSCTFDAPAWRSPWPTLLPAGTSAVELAIGSRGYVPPDALTLLVRGADGTVRRFSGTAGPQPTPLAGGEVLSVGAVSALEGWGDEGRLLWLESDAGGDRVVRFSQAAGRTVLASAPAITALASPGPEFQDVGTTILAGVAWAEPAPGGGSIVRYQWASYAAIATPAIPDLRGAAVNGSTLATVEVPPGGGPSQLFLRFANYDFTSLSAPVGPINVDPAHAAGPPALGEGGIGDWIVWDEAGDVVGRRYNPYGFLSSPTVLDSAPAAEARWPRIANYTLVFVEREAGLDRFEVRVQNGDGSTWRSLPSIPTGGQVVSFALEEKYFGPALAWIDTDGVAHLRVAQLNYSY